MAQDLVYLKPNVVIEPLVDSWYGWSHLISPATSAMNMLERHIKIMESYLMAPDIHANAVLNPKMRGGPFMDFPEQRTEQIKDLLDRTMRRKDLLEFAGSVKELNNILQSQAKGFSMEELYKCIPERLKGYVELYYDLNNNPGFRFFEALLYKSEYYQPDLQSIAIWLTDNDHRPFCLSTPRLPEKNVIHVPLPFDAPAIDALSLMKRVPQQAGTIRNMLGITPEQIPLFETFFTPHEPPAYDNYMGEKIRMRYFGHACILVETKDVSILVDPLISYYGYESDLEHFSELHLPEKIDYALITHNHQDHILFETLLPLRHRINKLIVPGSNSGKLEDPDLHLMFRHIGFKDVISVKEMETVEFADAVITGLPFTGEHSDLNILAKSCYLVEISGFKLLFLADSRIIEPSLYQHIHRQTGDVDVIFIGMECDGAPLTWLYGPLMPFRLPRDQDSSRRLSGSDCEKGMSVVKIFHPKEVYVYAMGQEPWVEFISSIKYTDDSNPIVQSDELIRQCREMGITAERLYGEKELLYNKKNTSSLSSLYTG